MKISHIVAVDKNGVIGKDGTLPWKNADDFKFFKATTMGKVLLMGRKTFESLPVKLKHRHIIVVTRNAVYKPDLEKADFVTCVGSIKAAINIAKPLFGEMMICGGSEIYNQTFEYANTLLVSWIDTEVESGDAFYKIPENSYKLQGTSAGDKVVFNQYVRDRH